MTSQLSYVFSYNRTATRPFSTILHTSFSPSASPRLWEKMSKSNWEKWTRCYWWGEGMEDLSQAMSQGGNGLMNGSTSQEPGSSDPDVTGDTSDAGMDFRISHLTGPNLPSGVSGSHKLVYLSADSPVELTTLSEDEIYIVGGIVDRNRLKVGPSRFGN